MNAAHSLPPAPALPDLPQRLSVDPNHSWYHHYWSHYACVLVNGIQRSRWLLVDGPGRYVVAFIDRDGGSGESETQTVRFEGDVVVVANENSWSVPPGFT